MSGSSGVAGGGGAGGPASPTPIVPQTINPAGTAKTLDQGNSGLSKIVLLTLDQASCALTMSNFVSGKYSELLLVVNVSAGKTITFTDSITWDGGGFPPVIPTVTTQLVLLIYSYDGTTFRGSHNQRARTIGWTQDGTLATATGKKRFYFTKDSKVISERCSLGTVGTVQATIFDVNKNGTTIYTTQANRPQVAVSTNAGSSTLPDVTLFAPGDYITLDIDQIGTSAGDASVQIEVLEAY